LNFGQIDLIAEILALEIIQTFLIFSLSVKSVGFDWQKILAKNQYEFYLRQKFHSFAIDLN